MGRSGDWKQKNFLVRPEENFVHRKQYQSASLRRPVAANALDRFGGHEFSMVNRNRKCRERFVHVTRMYRITL